MVEKVQATKIIHKPENDSLSDDSGLVAHLNKQKKKLLVGHHSAYSIAMLVPVMVEYSNHSLTSGGMKNVQTLTSGGMKNVLTEAVTYKSNNGDGRPALVSTSAVNTRNNNSMVLATNRNQPQHSQPSVSKKTEAAISKDSSLLISTTTQLGANASILLPSLSQSLSTKMNLGTGKHSKIKDNVDDAKLTLHVAHSQSFNSQAKTEQQLPSQKMPETLKKMQGQLKTSTTPSLEQSKRSQLNYAFKSLPGNHSVVVQVPTTAQHKQSIALFPSDDHAAYLLSNNLQKLAGHSMELFQPGHEHDDDKRDSQSGYEQEEEQE